MTVRVSTEDFDPAAEMASLAAAGDGFPGAVVTFTGLVRDIAGDSRITAMTLEHYPGMTEAELNRIRDEAMSRWPLSRATIIHRIAGSWPGSRLFLSAVPHPTVMPLLKQRAS